MNRASAARLSVLGGGPPRRVSVRFARYEIIRSRPSLGRTVAEILLVALDRHHVLAQKDDAHSAVLFALDIGRQQGVCVGAAMVSAASSMLAMVTVMAVA